ncbi:DNA polymerase III subunit gamma/tau [Castellaniella sp.]|uniref:DNA polymerase III subunit gamma/tau n=2 Tax=Castellaniella sp. TaxID=1955812 RepID=UPI0035635529
MSYLVLARKWRPRTFETLVGQEHVVRALTHALSSGRLHHAWLFTGTRGVGKTTLSRILAKSLNCEQGVTAAPCGHCQACTEIDAGRYVDYIELDAASNRGVDEMTQLLEQAIYAPSSGRYKVYMIDEVHMLTGHAFNAMLKTLEEPPEHVKFILATTDPQKIPVTVLSRCLQFNLKQMTVPAMVEHLTHVLEDEAIDAEPQALRLLAQAAAGSMRDALSLADQAISYAAGPLTAAVVGEMLGTLDQHQLVALVQALAARDAGGVLAVADDLLARGLSFRVALGDLATLLSRVAMTRQLGQAPADDPQADDLVALARLLAPDTLQLFYTVAVHSRAELALAPDEYAGFVMACLRMLALAPERDDPVADTAGDDLSLDVDNSSPDADGSSPDAGSPPPAADRRAPDMGRSPDTADPPEALAEGTPSAEDDGPPWDPDGDLIPDENFADFVPDDALELPVQVAERARGRSGGSAVIAQIPDPAAMTPQAWPELAARLPVTGAARALALNSEWVAADDTQIRLRVAIHTLSGGGGQERLCTVLSEHYARVLRLDIEYGETGADTAHAVSEAEQARRQEQAEHAAERDPLIQALGSQFGARIVPGSVRPA